MGLDKIVGQAVAGIIFLALIMSGISWYGNTRYDAGIAAERKSWSDVIAKANRSIENLNLDASAAKGERDIALKQLAEAAERITIVEIPVEVSKRCDLPDGVRRTLNAINVKRQP